MFGFRPIHELALLGESRDHIHVPIEDPQACSPEVQKELADLRVRLADVEWPSQCPWVGTDAWLLRYLERMVLLRNKDGPWRNEQGEPIPPLDAETFVRDCLKWRHDNGVNSILQDYLKDPEHAHLWREYPLDLHGVDRRGVPVVVERVALLSPKPFMARYTTADTVRLAIFSREWIAQKVYEATGGKSSRYTYVLSAANIGLRHSHSPLLEVLDAVVKIDERYFSCPLYAYYVVQAPWLFTLLKSLLRPFISSEPLEKIVVHSSHCVEHMSRCIDVANIPHQMGGQCRCGLGDGVECLKPFDEARLLAVPATVDTLPPLDGVSDAPLAVNGKVAEVAADIEEIDL